MSSCLCQLFGVVKKSLERRLRWSELESLLFQFVSVCVGDLGKSLLLSLCPVGPWKSFLAGLMNNVNHDWRARALPCLQTFPKPSPLPTHHILHEEASSSVAQGETEALFISLEHRWAVPAGTLHILSIKCYSLLSSLILLTWSHARFGGMAGPCTENLSLLFISH